MYIVKTISMHGIESCGFAVEGTGEMESYCHGVSESVSGIYAITVYSCNRPLSISSLPRHGISIWGPQMKLLKEIKTGYGCKIKR